MNFWTLLFSLPALLVLFPLDAHADWANPPVACIENQVPLSLPCLDLSGVPRPIVDLPLNLSEAETTFWTVNHRPDLSLCRAKEINRREANTPHSQAEGDIGWAWMWIKQIEDLDRKIDAIYEAAEKADMPPQILFGALKQESLLSNLGIAADGSNFSCGIGQVNILEWCEYMHTLSKHEQEKMGWPSGLSCSNPTLTTELVRPFYDIAFKKLRGRPDYELTPKEFEGITSQDVTPSFPPGSFALQNARFKAVASFVRECSNVTHGIASKGKELRRLFEIAVPKGLKKIEIYTSGETFPTQCRRPYRSKYYPLHTGWLLADAIYNAGEREVSLLQHYFRMTKETHESGTAWSEMTPLKLIEGLHWGGKWNPASGKIEYRNVYGGLGSQSWFKSCVVQRHIARVIQYTTLPGEILASSLEVGGCSQTSVPEYRKNSLGKISAK